jgi:hypothetical protein
MLLIADFVNGVSYVFNKYVSFVECTCSAVGIRWLAFVLRVLEALVQIWAQRKDMLTEVFRGFPYFLQVNTGIVP